MFLTRHVPIRVLMFLASAAVAIGSTLTAYGLGFLDSFERQSVDARFSIRGSEGPPRDVVLVKIDDETFSDFNTRGPHLQWPFPRRYHARVLDRIRAGKPRAIAFDVQFTEPTTDRDDNALIEAVAANDGRIVLATTEVADDGSTNVFGSQELVDEIGARVGNSNAVNDDDGVIRHLAYRIDGLKNFDVVAAEVATGKAIGRSRVGGDTAWIDFAGPRNTVTAYSYSKVLYGEVPPGAFRDRIVVIGATAPVLQDIHTAATGFGMSGPEVHVNGIETALRGFPLRSIPRWLNVLIIVVLGLIAPLASLRVRVLYSVAAAVVAGAIFVVGTQVGFEHGHVNSFVYPLSSLAIATVMSLGAHYTDAAFERERVRDVFSRFVPEAVVGQVLARTGGSLRLGGTEVLATIMFSDLRGFTTFSETLSAERVIFILNRYLSEMSEAILEHGGTLVSYMGDGIMAVFGAPIEQPDHADRALAAARAMVCDRLPVFNEWMREQGAGAGFRMGVGLNSGLLMVGNVGHERRMEYTAIGDVTNTASRIEGMTKGTPYSIFLAESTYLLLQSRPGDLVYVDEVEVRGRAATLKLWALDVVEEPAPPPEPEPQRAAANG